MALAARKLDISFTRSDPLPRRVELDLPGQLAREIIGYPVPANSPYLRRGLIPNWARPTLVIRNEEILTPTEAHPVREGDYIYLWRRRKRRRHSTAFSSSCRPTAPDPRLLGDFRPRLRRSARWPRFTARRSPPITPRVTLSDYFSEQLRRRVKNGRYRRVGPNCATCAQGYNGAVTTVGLRLAEPGSPDTWRASSKRNGTRCRDGLARARAGTTTARVALTRRRRTAPPSRTNRRARSCRGTAAPR